MDFLLLAPDRSRVVIEVDGVQHYGRPNPPDEQGRITHTAVPRLYAEMVAEDRRLRLAGYEIYRFCGWELKKGTGRQAALEILLHQPPRTAPEADAVKWWPHPAERVAALHGWFPDTCAQGTANADQAVVRAGRAALIVR
ncbi:hypothetical protein [Streptomyces sp. WAC06128]|uniref:hypothetical protein n=1 Tax=Streptomyces sp. WAC06128 TaxID=2487426 RepID=UPI0028AABB61|nr:hypothetical protein [Streptomyces sp. WAC06128]